MPKYYCDYCDTFLTHDSPSVRKTHCGGRKHKDNVKFYYQKWVEDQAQFLVDQTTAAFKQGKMNPGKGMGVGAMIPPPGQPMPPHGGPPHGAPHPPGPMPTMPGMPPMPPMPPMGAPMGFPGVPGGMPGMHMGHGMPPGMGLGGMPPRPPMIRPGSRPNFGEF